MRAARSKVLHWKRVARVEKNRSWFGEAGGEEEESGEEWKVDGRRARQAVDKGGAWGGAGKQNKRGKPLAIFH